MFWTCYTADPDKKYKICREYRRYTQSWRRLMGVRLVNHLSLIIFFLASCWFAARYPEKSTFPILATIALTFCEFRLRKASNSDVEQFIFARENEVAAQGENGDVHYAFRAVSEDGSTSVIVFTMLSKNCRQTKVLARKPYAVTLEGEGRTRRIENAVNVSVLDALRESVLDPNSGDRIGEFTMFPYLFCNKALTERFNA